MAAVATAALRPFLRRLCLGLVLGAGVHGPAIAAPGDTLFYDALNGNLNAWTVTGGGDARITNDTAQQGRSLRLGEGPVAAYTTPIAGNVPAARLELWIRRGADSFSEDPDSGENLRVEYRDSGGAWNLLESFDGAGTPGEIFTRGYDLPPAALHANLSVRLALTDANFGDYWHIDDVAVTELAPAAPPFGIGSCEDFESGLGGWSIDNAGGGDAGIGSATFNSPGSSLYTRWDGVEVTSNAVDLSAGSTLSLDIWVRRGADGFSENPEGGEDLILEYYASTGLWIRLESFPGGGPPGEILAGSYALPGDALHSGFRVRLTQIGGSGSDYDYWHADDVCVSRITPLLYSFEEDAWTGAAGEVEESGGSGIDGMAVSGATNDDATPAIPTDPGTCRYGDFDGVDDYIEIPDDPALDIANELTVAAWINMRTYPSELHTIVSKDTNYEFHIDGAGQVYWWWQADNVRTTGFSISLNQWHHIAVTYRSGSQTIYVDGIPRATDNYVGTLPQNDLPLFIGTDWNFVSRAFDGFIDEVTILPSELSQAEVQMLMLETHDCPTAAARFSINHDNYGIHCVAESITVEVVDSTAGTPLLDYNAAVELDTQSGNGTWTLVSGGGSLSDATPGDGIAIYDWPLGEPQAVFELYYPQGPPVIDVDVTQVTDPGVRDTDAEGALRFSPNGFTLTAAPLSNPPGSIPPFDVPQTAALDFPVYITAYGQTPDDPVCGVIESYDGPRDLTFWFDYLDPGSGTLDFAIDTNPIPPAEGSAAAQSVGFTNGQAMVRADYKDVGRVQVFVKDDTTGNTDLPNGIRGGTAGFVVRPADFELSNIVSGSGAPNDPTVTGPGDPVFARAGEAFGVTVTAVGADGDPTPNFGRESTPETVALDPVVFAPGTGSDGAIAAPTGFGAFSGGSASGADFAWSEVGYVQLRPHIGNDNDYLGAGDVLGTLSEPVGRFIPDHFTATLNTPLLDTACTAGQFTYEGQGFGFTPGRAPVITVRARSAGGGLTTNYSGAFFRLATGTSQNRSYRSPNGTVDESGLPPESSDPVVAETMPGQGTLTFDAGSAGLSFVRGTPVAPYAAAITLSIDVLDADGVAAVGAGPLGNPVTFGAAGGIVFDAGDEIRYGRVRLRNALGSELVTLPVPATVEYFAGGGTGFVDHVDDSCTSGVTLSFSAFTNDLDAGETCVLDSGSPGASGIGCPAAAPPTLRFADPAAAGDFNLHLQAPGAGNSGSVTVSATVPDWLRFDWDAANPGEEDPSGRAVFGLYPGVSRQIYLRELY